MILIRYDEPGDECADATAGLWERVFLECPSCRCPEVGSIIVIHVIISFEKTHCADVLQVGHHN